jgi:hypothetical protein
MEDSQSCGPPSSGNRRSIQTHLDGVSNLEFSINLASLSFFHLSSVQLTKALDQAFGPSADCHQCCIITIQPRLSTTTVQQSHISGRQWPQDPTIKTRLLQNTSEKITAPVGREIKSQTPRLLNDSCSKAVLCPAEHIFRSLLSNSWSN